MSEYLNNLFKQYSDEKLVSLILQDKNAFAEIVYRYEKKLLRYIKRISYFDDEVAKDILQEIFIKAYTKINSFDPSLKFSSWIYRIAHNETISTFRKTKTRPETTSFDYHEELLLYMKSDLDIQANLEKKELNQKVNLLIKKLSPKYKDILILKFLEEKSVKTPKIANS